LKAPRKLELRLVGPVRLTGPDGADLTPRGTKTQGLLVLVGSAPNLRRSRAFLQDKLWSDRGAEQGSASLRQSLVELRRALAAHRDCLVTESNMVALNPDRVSVVMTPQPDDWGPLGDSPEFADGLDIADPEFEHWIRDQRTAFADRVDTGPTPANRRAGKDPGDPTPVPPTTPGRASTALPALSFPARRYLWALAAVLVAVILILGQRVALAPPGTADDPTESSERPTAAVKGPSIAILPFESVDPGPEQLGFVKVVSREIVTDLAQFRNLFVVDVDAMVGSDPDAGPVAALKVGRSLGVRYVLRGLVQEADGVIRANVQLIETDNGRTRWATRIDGEAEAEFALQQAIVRGVVDNIEPILIPVCGTMPADVGC
jgi:TolB-like protein